MRLIAFICVICLVQAIVSGPLPNVDNIGEKVMQEVLDYADDKEINVVESLIEAVEDKPAENDNKNQQVPIDEHEKSSEVVHFNSKGESIENEKPKLKGQVACKAPKQDLPTAEPPKKKDHHHHHDNKLHHSSSVEEHGIRFDHHGNTKEEYKDTEEDDENHIDHEPRRKKKHKKTKMTDSDVAERRVDINNKLNNDVVNKQLQIRDLADEDSDENSEEDDIPLITIPMVDILKQYQRMAQGFQSSTEEYSDELPVTEKVDHFEDPHLVGALEDISAERRKVKQARKEGKKMKPAAQQLFGDLSKSEEEL